jgi:PAS domain S-box-containing protein
VIKKMATSGLRINQEFLFSIIDKNPLSTIVFDNEKNIIFLNAAVLQATGKSREEVIGQKDDKLLPPEMLAQYQSAFNQVQKTRQPVTCVIGLSINGKRSSTEISFVPVLDNEGQITYILTYFNNLDRLKELEDDCLREQRQLQTEQKIFDGIMENIQEGLIVTTNPFKILAVSRYATDKIGKTADELCNASLEEFYIHFPFFKTDSTPLPPRDFPLLKALEEGKITTNAQFLIKDSHGDLRTIILNANPMINGQGAITGALISFRDVTEVKAIEKQFAYLFEHSSDGILLLDAKSRRYTDCNRSCERILGYSKEEILEKDLGTFTVEELKPQLQDLLDQLTSEEFKYYDWKVKNKLGEIILLELSGSLIRVENKTFFQAIFRDVTERKKIEQALEEERQRFFRLVENAPVGMLQSTVDGVVIYANPEFLQIMEYDSLEELKKHKSLEFYKHPADRKNLLDIFNRQRESVKNFEAEFVTRTGKEKTVVIGGIVSHNEINGMILDITARKTAEEELKRSELKYRTLIERSNDAINLLDLERSVYIEVNSKFLELTGYSREELFAQPIGSLITPVHSRAKLPQLLEEIRKTGELMYDWEIQRKNGEIIPVQVSSRIIEFEGVPLLFSIFRDTSLIRQAQLVLERDKKTLEKLVDERTNALFRAKRLSELGTLAASIAHELRNPLSSIDLARYTIQKKTTEREKINRSLEVIEKKVQESNQLIDNLLFFTRIRSPQSQVVNLYHIIQECQRTTVARHNQPNVKNNNTTKEIEHLTINADPVQIAEVLYNLLNNAYEALGNAGLIEIIAKEEANFVVISIKDNGPGMPAEVKEKLFEPFFTTKLKGTGLGLAISKQIIENHGGKIIVESEKNQGTTITIKLPYKR